MTIYIVPFIIAFIISVFFIVFGIFAAKKLRWRGRKEKRHIHQISSYRVGGIAMVVSFVIAILIDKNLFLTEQIYAIIAGSIILMFVGFWDDLKELFWKTQFFFQIAVAVLIFVLGIRIPHITVPITGNILELATGPGVLFSMLLVIVWIVVMINSMNWLDGVDGLSGGVSFIGAATIFFLSLKPEVNQPPVAILAAILAGTFLGFLIFNFNPSRILAGTSGSMFMGFSLAVMAIFAGTKIATAILVMSIPIVDFVWVIGERIRNKKSIFQPDKNHFHYKLMDLGWSQKKVAISFYVVTILISVIALNTRALGKSITLFATIVIMAATLVFVNKKIKRLRSNQ